MKYLLNLVLILALGVTIMSCSSTSTVKVRAVDVLTNIPAPVECDTSIYKAGDTVWVNINQMKVSTKTHLYIDPISYRKFVIQP